MLAGEPPFTGPTPQAIVVKRLTGPPQPIRTVREVPEALEQADSHGVSPEPRRPVPTGAGLRAARRRTRRPAPGHGPYGAPGRARPRAPGVRWRSQHSCVGRRRRSPWLDVRDAPALPRARPHPARRAPLRGAGGRRFGYLAEGMVDLLSRNLNGVGALVTVDPGRVMSAIGARGEARRTRRRARPRDRPPARRRPVHRGQRVPAGGQLRIQAQLYQRGRGLGAFESIAQASPRATARRSSSWWTSSPPSSCRARSGARAPGWRGRRRSTTQFASRAQARTSTRSGICAPPNTTRRSRGSSAAIEVDSSFALAHYRLGGRRAVRRPHGSDRARDRAGARAGRAAERARSPAAGRVHRPGPGIPDRAERQYREFLEAYPDDLEAQFQLANLLYNYNAPRGRSPAEAREYVRRGCCEVDPKFICPI